MQSDTPNQRECRRCTIGSRELKSLVERYVGLRDAGLLPAPAGLVEREKLIDPFLAKVEERVERSNACRPWFASMLAGRNE